MPRQILLDIYGHVVQVEILALHDFGTIDVQRLSDGQCFRKTGLVGLVEMIKEADKLEGAK